MNLLLIEIWVVSDLGLLQIALLWTFVFIYSFMYLFGEDSTNFGEVGNN